MDPEGPDLRESQTFENLKAAFAGQCQATARYALFAARAHLEGQVDVARLFGALHDAADARARGHLEFLKDVGDPQTGVPVATLEEMLRSALERAVYEHETLYKGFAQTARREGFDRVADWFALLERASRLHADHLRRALDAQARGPEAEPA